MVLAAVVRTQPRSVGPPSRPRIEGSWNLHAPAGCRRTVWHHRPRFAAMQSEAPSRVA